MSRYDVNVANTNRHVRFRVEAGNAADRDTGIFLALKGRAPAYPHVGQVTTTPTVNQELAQLRLSLVVRELTRWAPVVGVEVTTDSAGTGFGSAVVLVFEQDESGSFMDSAWLANPTTAKHVVTDIVDELGLPNGSGTGKTKPGLQTLLNGLRTISYDGGTTGPFGTLSAGGAIVLPDGRTTAGAPELSTSAGTTAGLTISYVGM